MDAIGQLVAGLQTALQPELLLFALIGGVLGTLTGVLPGVGPTSAIAILLPLTAVLQPLQAIVMLSAIYYGSQYGGSTTAILLNIPGEVSSVTTVFDGYPAARSGRAGPALVVAAIGSFVAGTIGLIGLTFFGPLLADVGLAFGPAEYFALVLVALTVVVSLSSRSLLKGLVSAAFGLFIAMIGLDPLTGTARLTLGTTQLLNGVNFVAASIGLFAISEVLITLEQPLTNVVIEKIQRFFPTRAELRETFGSMLRGSGIGFALGLLPGIGPGIVSFLAYDTERRVSREPHRFGTGMLQGVAAPEAANNAATSSGFVPLFAFGIPATPALAVLLGAFLIYGLQPGPLLFETNASFVWTVIASMYVGNVILLVLNIPLVRLWVRLLTIPAGIMLPVIVVLSVIGAYSLRGNYFDVWVMLVFGLVGYVMRKHGFPIAPLILTQILGERLEADLRRTSVLMGGDWDYLLGRPLAVGLLVVAAVLLVLSVRVIRRQRLTEE